MMFLGRFLLQFPGSIHRVSGLPQLVESSDWWKLRQRDPRWEFAAGAVLRLLLVWRADDRISQQVTHCRWLIGRFSP